MSNSVAETVLGAMVLATAGGFLVYAGQHAGLQMAQDSYSLSAAFRTAEGVLVGTDVRLAGIKVGAVTDLELDTETYQARAEFSIRNDIVIPEDSDIKVAQEGLLGGYYLEITPGASDFMLSSGDEILNTQGSVSLLDLFVRFGLQQ
jgi:phospholipid/cholesterol/gamma-HCH transport system substrate-binding protein